MSPKKGGGNKKGKSPARRQAVPQVSPPQSSSDDESWVLLKELQAKMAGLEAKRAERPTPRGSDTTPRRSARDTKGRRRAEIRAITLELTKHFDALESEQGRETEGRMADEGSAAGAVGTGGRKRRRTMATDGQDPGEGTSVSHDPYDKPSTSGPGAAEASGSARAISGVWMPKVQRSIKIIGHSYIYWAVRYAAASHWGNDLGLGAQASISWMGIRGMQWLQLGRLTAFGSTPPDVLVVHLGGNDLPRVPGKALILDILREFNRLHVLYPTLRIVWSTIIPRLSCRGAWSISKINKARRQVNREVCRGISYNGLGSVINHHRIQISKLEYFREDGVHLSEAGLDVFLDDLRGGLLVELEMLGVHMGHS
ncbi:uncharacterized protein LOC140705452 [Pogona vitticeps]